MGVRSSEFTLSRLQGLRAKKNLQFGCRLKPERFWPAGPYIQGIGLSIDWSSVGIFRVGLWQELSCQCLANQSLVLHQGPLMHQRVLVVLLALQQLLEKA